MAIFLCGGASRIVLRLNVQQKITAEGQEYIKEEMKHTLTDGELIHWASQGGSDDEAAQLISFGYKGPEHKEDADFIVHGASYDPFYPKWLQFIEVSIKDRTKPNIFDFTAVKLTDSKVNTVLDLERNVHNLDTDVTWEFRYKRDSDKNNKKPQI